jgi:hypothetical protein
MIVLALGLLGVGAWQIYGLFKKKKVFSAEKATAVIRQQAGTLGPVKDATCPDGKEMKKGDTVTCTVAFADGTTVPIVLTAMNDNYDFQLAFTEPLTGAEAFAKIVADGIKEQSKVDAKVDCGTGIKRGKTLECTATAPDGTTAKVIGDINVQGSGSWRVETPPPTPPPPTPPQ